MFFGMFGSIFLLAQFFQTVQGYSPLESGLRILPWTAMPMFVAPIAGALSDRIGGRPSSPAGWRCRRSGSAGSRPCRRRRRRTPTSSRRSSSPGSAWRCSSPRREHRPLGGAARRRRARPRAPTTRSASSAASSASRCWPRSSRTRRLRDAGGLHDGIVTAMWVGAAVVGVGAVIALAVPGKQRAEAPAAALEGA